MLVTAWRFESAQKQCSAQLVFMPRVRPFRLVGVSCVHLRRLFVITLVILVVRYSFLRAAAVYVALLLRDWLNVTDRVINLA